MARLRRAVAGALWYVREVMGENAYEHYPAPQRRDHPDAQVWTGWRSARASAAARRVAGSG
jgi:hypothetical protein